jgi:anhydro-N-acetylmuramic acid kinase
MELKDLREKEARFVVCVACNPSGLGVDGVFVRLKGTGRTLQIKFIATRTFPYSSSLRNRLMATRFDARDLGLLNFELGGLLADAAIEMMKMAEHEECVVDFIASQGHVVSHVPPRSDSPYGYLAVGESAVVAERTGLPVFSDFAQRDIAGGGQGAPLEAYPDYLLFGRTNRTVACISLGAVTSITVITPKMEEVTAFQSGPGMLAVNSAVRRLSSNSHENDDRGALAEKGEVIDEFLEYMLEHPYYNRVPPKSTTRDEFSYENYLRDALDARSDRSMNDLLATVTAAVAYSVIRSLSRFVMSRYEVTRMVLTGEGAHNVVITEQLKKAFPEIVIRTSDEYGIPTQSWACVASAILANEALCGTPASIPSATGCAVSLVLGKLTLG